MSNYPPGAEWDMSAPYNWNSGSGDSEEDEKEEPTEDDFYETENE